MGATRDSTLADPQQLIADLQRELADAQRQLAESNAERDEGRAREAAIAEVLQVINSSPGDLAPVFDEILEKALHLCGAAFGVLAVAEPAQFRTVATRGVPAAYAEFRRLNPTPPTAGSVASRLLAGETLVHTIDMKEGELYASGDPIRRAIVDLGGARTSLVVALRTDRKLLGGFNIYRQEVRPFSDKQIALLQNFAAQAVIAMENARLITETREALEQQTATAEVLQVINSSPGDLGPVFGAILEKAHALCGAASGGLMLIEGNRYRAVAVHGDPGLAEYWLDLGWIPFPTGEDTLFGRLSRGELVHLRDAAVDDGTPKSEQYHRLVELAGARSLVMVPLRKDHVLFGTITAFRKEPNPFTDKQIALLQNFAAQAVIAMENARLITETREALEQQTATAEVLQVINSSPGDLAPVFEAMVEKAMRLCGAVHGSLTSYDGNHFRCVAGHNLPEALLELLRKPRRAASNSPQERLLQGEPIVHIADMRALPMSEDNEVARAAAEIGFTRTAVYVPLRKDNTLLGYIGAQRNEVRPFTDKQIALLQNFASQAVIAMENARLITETREALEQQTATAEVLGVINSSPGDLTPVFDAMLERATRLCDAVQGVLWTIDGKQVKVAGTHQMAPEFLELLRRVERGEAAPPPPLLQIMGGERLIHIADVAEHQLYRTGDPLARAAVESGGVRTLVWVALIKDNAAVGAFAIARREARHFTDKQIVLLQNFASQAVIAMENARLLTETREALDQQTATAEVLQVINSSPGNLIPVFDAMLERATRLCEADFGTLWTFDGERFQPAVGRGHGAAGPNTMPEGLRPAAGMPLGQLITGKDVATVVDAATDPAFQSDPATRSRIAALGTRSAVAVALRKDDALFGAITANRSRVEPYSHKQIALLQNFAAQAVIAMENARLLGELRQRTDEVAELNRGLEARVAEQVEELGRVGRLKRFLAPQLAELIVSQGDEKILESHRREIVVVFCDLRGYTAFTETAEPEEVLDFLREYHGALGPLVSQFEGTLDQFSGDGIMVFFNDPVPCPDPAERAVAMAVAMREAAGALIAAWRRRGRLLGFGAGIAQGYATLGQIGFADRSGYTAIGTVCNLAARLCAEAKDGQILIGQRVAVAVEERTPLEEVGELTLKGLTQPVVAYNVLL